ncbi:MAG: PEP/pyruvate-binding domain-containing protein [Thermoplasmata archaeon]
MPSSGPLAQFQVDREQLPSGIEIIGGGSVGGKAKGLIFVSYLMEAGREKLCDFPEMLKIPRSTIVATDVFDQFIQLNRLGDVVELLYDRKLTDEEMNVRFLTGNFPPGAHDSLMRFLEDENRPLIVRSSSVLEDRPEHSFAGIYQSVFITNKGPLTKRIAELEMAIRIVYTSTYGPNARKYAERMEAPWQDEKMAILIQDVVGSHHEDELYYPLLAGVAFSKNYYPWSERIGVDDGLCRIVAGLGTRAVGRFRATVFSPSLPELRPEGMAVDDIVGSSQDAIDALDYGSELLLFRRLRDIQEFNEKMYMLGQSLKDDSYFVETPKNFAPDERIILTFKPILATDRYIPLVALLRSLMQNLERVTGRPIDIEFAFDFQTQEGDTAATEKGYFYLVQVRPLGRLPIHRTVSIPPDVPESNVLLRSKRVLGNGIIRGIRNIVWVQHRKYDFTKGYDIAREVGRINETFEGMEYVLIGPGRWATTNPELGVPVNYSEISNAAVVVELSYEKFSPELSYGTHFFADMEASNMLYIPLFLEKGDYLNEKLLEERESKVDAKWVKVIEISRGLNVYVDGNSRQGFIHF